MAVSRKAISRKGLIYRYLLAIGIILSGLILNILNIGNNYFFSYSSVGNYLIFVGFLIIFITSLMGIIKKDRIIDERIQKIGAKAMAWVWYTLFIGGFLLMIIDGINPIPLSIGQFIAYSICVIILVYFIAYKILEKYN